MLSMLTYRESARNAHLASGCSRTHDVMTEDGREDAASCTDCRSWRDLRTSAGRVRSGAHSACLRARNRARSLTVRGESRTNRKPRSRSCLQPVSIGSRVTSSRRGVLQDVMQRAAVMRVGEIGRAMIAAAALTVVLGGCASTRQPSLTASHQTITMPSMGVAASTSAPRAAHTSGFYAVLRHIRHAVVSGVSWLFRPPTGVYGPPEKVAYSSARTWKSATGTLGCASNCTRVQRNSVQPIN